MYMPMSFLHEVKNAWKIRCQKLMWSEILVSFLHFLIHQQVIPKSEILRLGVLEQSKEEVIVQVGTAWHFSVNL